MPAVHGELHPAAYEGTDIHKFLSVARNHPVKEALAVVPKKMRPRCSAINLEQLKPYWERHAKTSGEAAYAYNAFTRKARFLGEDINRAYDDEKPGDVSLTMDIAGVDTGFLVLDYKTGKHPVALAWDNWQLRVGALTLHSMFGVTNGEQGIAYLQEDGTWQFDMASVSAMDLDSWGDELAGAWKAVEHARKQVEKGRAPDVSVTDECRYCVCVDTCPAHVALVRNLPTVLADVDNGVAITPAQKGQAWETVKRCETLLEKIKAGLLATARQEPIPLPNGKMLRVQDEAREYIDGGIAEHVLYQHFTPEDVLKCIKPSTSKKLLQNLGPEMDRALTLIRMAGGIETKYVAMPREVLDKRKQEAK